MENEIKILSRSAAAERKLAAAHIKDYRKNDRRVTQEQFGKLIDRDKQTVARYEKGETEIAKDVIARLVTLSGYIPEYWKGLTECKKPNDYEEECASRALDCYAADQRGIDQRRSRVRSLMNACGYGYEDFSDDLPGHVFAEFSDDPHTKEGANMAAAGFPHKIVSSSQVAFFSEVELSALLSDISDLIAFRCFQKGQQKAPRSDT